MWEELITIQAPGAHRPTHISPRACPSQSSALSHQQAQKRTAHPEAQGQEHEDTHVHTPHSLTHPDPTRTPLHTMAHRGLKPETQGRARALASVELLMCGTTDYTGFQLTPMYTLQQDSGVGATTLILYNRRSRLRGKVTHPQTSRQEGERKQTAGFHHSRGHVLPTTHSQKDP